MYIQIEFTSAQHGTSTTITRDRISPTLQARTCPLETSQTQHNERRETPKALPRTYGAWLNILTLFFKHRGPFETSGRQLYTKNEGKHTEALLLHLRQVHYCHEKITQSTHVQVVGALLCCIYTPHRLSSDYSVPDFLIYSAVVRAGWVRLVLLGAAPCLPTASRTPVAVPPSPPPSFKPAWRGP